MATPRKKGKRIPVKPIPATAFIPYSDFVGESEATFFWIKNWAAWDVVSLGQEINDENTHQFIQVCRTIVSFIYMNSDVRLKINKTLDGFRNILEAGVVTYWNVSKRLKEMESERQKNPRKTVRMVLTAEERSALQTAFLECERVHHLLPRDTWVTAYELSGVKTIGHGADIKN
jgi:hypothetical protein